MLVKKLKYQFHKRRLGFADLMKLPYVNKNNGPLVLVYHGISNGDPLQFNSRFLHKGDFEKHLQFFSNECHVLKLEELNSVQQEKGKLSVVITFDDGYMNNYTEAVPLLEKYQIPASFCVCNPNKNRALWPDVLDIGAKFPQKKIELNGQSWSLDEDKSQIRELLINGEYSIIDDFLDQVFPAIETLRDVKEYWKLMQDEELQKIEKSDLFELLPHSSRHLSATHSPMWQQDFFESIEFLQNLTQKEVKRFAYPYGHVNVDAIHYLKEQHKIEQHLLVDPIGQDKGLIPRFVINPHVSFSILKRFMYRGAYL